VTYFPVLSLYSLAWVLFVLSMAGMSSAWLFFRRPGQKFWVAHPIWRAREALKPVGVWLWWISYPLGIAAAVLLMNDVIRGL